MPLTRLCRQTRFAALDFESAGAVPGDTDTPVQIGVASASLEGIPELWTSYIATHRPILWSAAKVHGITTEHLKNAPSFSSLWPDINSRLSHSVLVGHNLGTERRFLRAFPGHNFGPWLDTLTLSRDCLPGQPDYSLGAICDLLDITKDIRALVPDKNWHDALFDAAASLLLVRFLIHELNLTDAPLYMLGGAVREK